jgi:signal transduction histidine kinase
VTLARQVEATGKARRRVGAAAARPERGKSARAEGSSLRLLAITALSIVLAEIAGMAVVDALRPRSYFVTTLIDVLVMITLAFPVLYALSFRPLVRLSESRSRVQKELEAVNRELELANRSEREAREAADSIRSAAIALGQSLDLHTVLASLLERLGRLVPFDRARVMLLQDESLLCVRAVLRKGCDAEFLPRGQVTFEVASNPVVRELLSGARGMRIDDMHTHPEFGPRMRPEFERSWMGIPLVAGGSPIGLYSLCRAEAGFYHEEHLQLAEALSAPGSVAIQNALLFEELRDSRERLKTLSHRLVDAQEKERRFVAQELHDEAGQALTSLKIGLRLLERTSHDLEVSAKAAELQRTAESVQENLHRLAANLRPVSLDHFGLVAALSQLVGNLSGSEGAHVELETIGLGADRLPSRVETELYRIAQEAITNAVRHARAREIGVVLERRNGRLRLIVEDDGCGFDLAGAERNGRLGLIGIRERAETLGGTLSVESSEGTGTTVLVEAPDGG